MGKIILNDIEYGIGTPNSSNVDTTNLVKKDNIVTTLDDTVTDEQIPSAKAVHTAIQNVSVGVPADVYSKTEVDNLLADKADSTDIIDSYTKEEVDDLLNDKVDSSSIVDAYSKTEVDNLLDSKADSSSIVDAYSKDETNDLLDAKVNVDDLVDAYSKTEVDDLLANKADSSAIIDAYSKTEVDDLLTAKADTTALEQLEGALTGYSTLEYLEEVKTDLENEIANINIPTTLPASDVYAWAKASTKPTYTASEVGALASNGTATNASKVANNLTLQIAGTTKNTFNGSSAQTFNIPNASTSTSGVMTTTQVTTLNNHTTEINNLKNTVVDGKTSVANAINGKLGTTLSNQTSFADMAYYINTIPSMASVGSLPNSSEFIQINLPVTREVLGGNTLAKGKTVTIDGGLIMFVCDDDRESLKITPINAPIKVYGRADIVETVNVGTSFSTDGYEWFIVNPSRTQLSCTRVGLSDADKWNPAINISIS